MPRRRSGTDWAGVAALVIAAGLAFGWAGAIILSATPFTDPITESGASLLNGLGQVLAGALATYLGVSSERLRNRRRNEADDEEPDDDE